MNELKVIKENSKQKITLCENEGKYYLKREIQGDKREVYKRLQKINCPNIPKIFSVELGENTVVSEEYIEGKTLAEMMESGYRFTPREIKNIVNKVLCAMEQIHSCCIIHRDIKPENIMLDTKGNVWLIDFDIARIFRGDLRRDTEQMGSFGYAPIEQYGMIPTDMKSDIYSFGVTLKKLTDYANINGVLCKISEKCRKLDPSERFENVGQIKSKIAIAAVMPWIIGVVVLLVAMVMLFMSTIGKGDDRGEIEESETIPEGYIEVDDETMELLRFWIEKLPEKDLEYTTYENFNSVSIFNDEEVRHYVEILTDGRLDFEISLGKNRNTFVNASYILKDGLLELTLDDKMGHTFSHTFASGDDEYDVIYPDNRRVNAELACHDVNGDGVEELLVGVADCSFNVGDKVLYPYFNACWGWVIRYDEARGFVLCEGEMFAQNHKFVVYRDMGNVYLSTACITDDKRIGYTLEGDKLKPIY